MSTSPPEKEPKTPVKKLVIGWWEYVDFEDWGIDHMRAKVDTGARTSALHVENLQILRNRQARFQVILSRKHTHRRVWVTAPVVKWARVRSSTGNHTVRCFVRTRVKIGPLIKEIDLSLISREDMTFRMLLGREALEKDFVVDVSRSHVLGGTARKKEGLKKTP